jgi:hypothetical protein
LGKQFFDNQGVGRYVRTRHRLEKNYFVQGTSLPTASLVTVGADQIWMIEPLKNGRATFEKDVSDVAERFQSAKYAQTVEEHAFRHRPLRTMLLLLPGITDEVLDELTSKTSMATDMLVDSRFAAQRKLATRRIETVGKSGENLLS